MNLPFFRCHGQYNPKIFDQILWYKISIYIPKYIIITFYDQNEIKLEIYSTTVNENFIEFFKFLLSGIQKM